MGGRVFLDVDEKPTNQCDRQTDELLRERERLEKIEINGILFKMGVNRRTNGKRKNFQCR
jgi:hypothetical protein